MIPKNIKKIITVLSFCVLINSQAFSMTKEDFRIEGYYTLSEENQEYVDKSLESLPVAVGIVFNRLGGNITFQKDDLVIEDEIDEDAAGAYYKNSNAIFVKTDSYVKFVLPHEFGHFVYSKSHKFFSDDAKKSLQKIMDYMGEKNESEAFATMYSYYLNNPEEYRNYQDMETVYKESFHIFNRLNLKVKSKADYGPSLKLYP